MNFDSATGALRELYDRGLIVSQNKDFRIDRQADGRTRLSLNRELKTAAPVTPAVDCTCPDNTIPDRVVIEGVSNAICILPDCESDCCYYCGLDSADGFAKWELAKITSGDAACEWVLFKNTDSIARKDWESGNPLGTYTKYDDSGTLAVTGEGGGECLSCDACDCPPGNSPTHIRAEFTLASITVGGCQDNSEEITVSLNGVLEGDISSDHTDAPIETFCAEAGQLPKWHGDGSDCSACVQTIGPDFDNEFEYLFECPDSDVCNDKISQFANARVTLIHRCEGGERYWQIGIQIDSPAELCGFPSAVRGFESDEVLLLEDPRGTHTFTYDNDGSMWTVVITIS